MKKTVVIDVRFLYNAQRYSGISYYGRSLLKILIQNIANSEISNKIELYLLGYKNINSNLHSLSFNELEIADLSKFIDLKLLSLGENIYKKESNKIKKFFHSISIDIFFTLDTSILSILRKLNFTKILSLIDINKAVFKDLDKNLYAIPRKIIDFLLFTKQVNIFKEVDKVILPSIQSKNFLESLGINTSNTTVIYPGVEKRFFFDKTNFTNDKFSQIRQIYDLPEKYFFFNNSLENDLISKYLLKFLEKLHIFHNKYEDVPSKVVIVGKDFNKSSKNIFMAKSLKAKRFLDNLQRKNLTSHIITTDVLEDEEYEELLYFATASLAFQSPYKFNMVLLNSMAAQVPIITNIISCEEDITKGNCIAYIDMLKESSDWDQVFNNINQEIKLGAKNEKVLNNLNLAKKFNWDATAGKIWDIFKQYLTSL